MLNYFFSKDEVEITTRRTKNERIKEFKTVFTFQNKACFLFSILKIKKKVFYKLKLIKFFDV